MKNGNDVGNSAESLVDPELQELELLKDVLRAESNGHDLGDNGFEVTVHAETSDGEFYQIGSVDKAVMYQSPKDFWAMVSRIKFTKRFNATDHRQSGNASAVNPVVDGGQSDGES